jgi:hypothetical protein
VRFSEVVRRLNGISTPVFGVSWNPGEAGVAVARRVLTYLADRRVLFSPYELEVADHCIRSVIEIRHALTEQLMDLGGDDEIAPHLIAMRAACRKFLDSSAELDRHGAIPKPGQFGGTPNWVFDSALGELRGVVGVHVAQIAAKYGLDVEDGLASILPIPGDESPGDWPYRKDWPYG